MEKKHVILSLKKLLPTTLILVKTLALILDFGQALSKSKSQTLQFQDIKKFSQGFMKS